MPPPSAQPAILVDHAPLLPATPSRSRAKVTALAPATLPARAEAIVSRYAQGKAGFEETVLGLYHGEISVAGAELAARRLWGPDSGVTDLAGRARELAQDLRGWLARPFAGARVYVFLQSVMVPRRVPGRPEETALLTAVGVDDGGRREVLALAGTDAPGPDWDRLLADLHRRGLRGVRLFVGDNDPAAAEAVRRRYPAARYQGCLFELEQRVLRQVASAQVHWVLDAFDALRGAVNREQAQAITLALAERFRRGGLPAMAAQLTETSGTVCSHLDFPRDQWARLRDTAPLRRLLTRVRARLRVLGPLADDEALVLLAAAQLRQAPGVRTRRRFIALGAG